MDWGGGGWSNFQNSSGTFGGGVLIVGVPLGVIGHVASRTAPFNGVLLAGGAVDSLALLNDRPDPIICD